MRAFVKDCAATMAGLLLVWWGHDITQALHGHWWAVLAGLPLGVPGLILLRYVAKREGAW